jgi:LysM repeat protein
MVRIRKSTRFYMIYGFWQRIRVLLIIFLAATMISCAGRRPWPPVEEEGRLKRQPVTAQPTEAVSETGETGDQFTGVYHTVEEGQTLWRIANTYDVDLETLQWVNDVEDVTDLRVGRILFIPGATNVMKVVPVRPEDETPPSLAKILVAWPLRGRQTSGFGPRNNRPHQGVDIAAPKGTPVKAAAGGKVVYSGAGMKGYGKVVVVKHESDLSTVYAHNSALLVRMGDRVNKGQVIARVGSTGWATGPHLHFEVRRRGVPENPMDYLPAP